MKRIAILATIALLTSSSLANAFQSGSSVDAYSKSGRQTQADSSAASDLIKTLNTNGAYSRDFYRLSFMQLMGLVFFDPNTPDISSCQKEVLNYHLPELANKQVNLGMMEDEIADNMAQVYTEDEIAWLQQFYKSPFGQRMLKKQFDMNERMTRIIAARYAQLKPEFTRTYTIMAERCGGKAPSTPIDAPNLSDSILSPTGSNVAPIPASPTVTP